MKKNLLFLIIILVVFSFLGAEDAKADTATLRPNAPGDYTNLGQVPTSGANWDKVDDVTPDGNATYVWGEGYPSYSDRDLYNLSNHTTGTGTINFVKVYIRCLVTATSEYSVVRPEIKTGGSGYQGDNNVPTTNYTTYSHQWGTNPKTGSAWTWAEIDELQAGFFLYDDTWPDPNGEQSRATQVYVEVNYSVIVALTVSTEIADVDIQNNQATLNGNITDTGGEDVTEIGFEWGTSPGSYPNSWTETGSYTIGTFSHQITGLNPGNIYYYRAKAYNSAGWGYGSERQLVIYTASGGQQQFTTLPITYTLTVSKTGTGSGIVIDTGINCGTDCSESYDSGTSVTLTATPDDVDSEFSGWSGDCSGTGTCTLTMDSDKNVTATFNPSDTTPPTTEIKVFRNDPWEDVTAAENWLRADNYTIKFEDNDPEPNSSGLKNCEYYVYDTQASTFVVLPTPRTCGSWSLNITAGTPLYHKEGPGAYLIYSYVIDNADLWDEAQIGLNFDFTPPETWIE